MPDQGPANGQIENEHVGTEQRWVPLFIETGETNFDGREYVRWVCSCGEASEPFIDNGDCERDFRRHEQEGSVA